jgi:hypothetical protein
MLVILEKANYRVEIIRSVGLGLMRFTYNGKIGKWFYFFTSFRNKVQHFQNNGWKIVKGSESEVFK